MFLIASYTVIPHSVYHLNGLHIYLPSNMLIRWSFSRSVEVTWFFFWQNISDSNALLCKVLFLLSKVTKLKVSLTSRALLQVSSCYNLILFWVKEKLSFPYAKETSLNSRNTCGIYQTLHCPVFVCFYTGHKV